MKVIIFGAGMFGMRALNYFTEKNVYAFVDNNSNMVGKQINNIKVISYEDYLAIKDKFLLLIAVSDRYTQEIIFQLAQDQIYDYIIFSEIPQNIIDSTPCEEYLNYICNENIRHSLSSDFIINELQKTKFQLKYMMHHSDIMSLKPATGEFRKLQLDVLAFVEEVFSDFSNLKIYPFLVAGSLIGAVRHNGFIPWDDDMDFGLMRTDYNALIEHCKKNYSVYIFPCNLSDFSNAKMNELLNNQTKNHENEYVLFIYYDMIKLVRRNEKGISKSVDFFVFDYINENYSIADYKNRLVEILDIINKTDYIPDIISFLQKEIDENPMYSKEPTSQIYMGIDSFLSHRHLQHMNEFIKTNDLLPFKSRPFENTFMYTANNEIAFIENTCPTYLSFPDDIGLAAHRGKNIQATI